MADARSMLDQLIRERGEDYASLSRLLGRNAAYIQQFIRRGTPRKLDEDDRRTLARYFRVDEALLGGPANDGAATSITESRTVYRGRVAAGLMRIPRLAVGASAGAGALDPDERGAGAFGFDPAYIRTLGSDPAMLSAIKVAGDSMDPTLGDGDDILVDRADAADRLRDGIYVLRFDDALNVKRIAMNPAGGVTVASDNPAYPTWADCDLSRMTIIGRVVWVGRRVR
ncbi:MAG: S24 family peptidase [Pseudomonadota bacterium]